MTTYLVNDSSTQHEVAIQSDDGVTAHVRVGDAVIELSVRELADGAIAVLSGGKTRRFRSFADGRGSWLSEGPVQRCFEVVEERESWLQSGAGGGGGGGDVKASMPGRVVKLAVAVGDVIQPGDVVAVLEAMKMENDVKATIAATVIEIAVAVGEAVEAGQLLLRLESTS